MSVKVLIDHDAYDALPDLSKAIVAEQTDAALLTRWYVTLCDKRDELREFVKAYDLAGMEDNGAAGKLAFVSIAASWVAKRLRALGEPIPDSSDPHSVEIGRQRVRIEALKQQVRDLGGDPDDSLSPRAKAAKAVAA